MHLRIITAAMIALLAGVAGGRAQLAAADAASGDGATGLTLAPGFLDESRILSALGSGALGNCFFTSIRVGGFEVCTTPIGLPLVCTRMRNNMISNLMEAAGRRRHYALMTIAAKIFLSVFAKTQYADPTNKKLGEDTSHGSGASGSGRVQARTLAPPLISNFVKVFLAGAFAGTLCDTIDVKLGYLYFADGDETPGGGSMWRAIISPYYLNASTAGISLFAKSAELTGLCSLDTNFMLCFGGYGTKYPTSGDIAAGSPALRLITGCWRAQEIHSAPAGTLGPYDTSLGAPIHAMLHLPTAMVGGITTLLPPYSPGSYIQWLYPGVGGAPVGHPDLYCSPLGIGPGTSPIIMNQMTSETLNKTFSEEDTLGFAYWTRYTCCNWCTGSVEATANHFIPERGFDAVLTRIP